MAADPLQQFRIERLVEIDVAGIDVSFTNSSLWMVIAVVVATLFLTLTMRARGTIPTRGQMMAEMLYGAVANMVRDNVGSGGQPYFPFIFTLFVFVLFGNLLGMRIFFAGLVSLILMTANAQAQEKITVLLDWFINPDHGPLIVAQEKGFFEAAGLEVEMVEPADPSAPPKLVAAGQADLAVSYQPQLHVQVAEGLPLVRIATLVATPLNSLVVLEDGPIQSIPDLKGKKVGFSVGGFEDVLLGTMNLAAV